MIRWRVEAYDHRPQYIWAETKSQARASAVRELMELGYALTFLDGLKLIIKVRKDPEWTP